MTEKKIFEKVQFCPYPTEKYDCDYLRNSRFRKDVNQYFPFIFDTEKKYSQKILYEGGSGGAGIGDDIGDDIGDE